MQNEKKAGITINKIEKVLVKIRPYIQMHGGDVFLVSMEKGVVTLKISGACADCELADLTYNRMLGSLLREISGVKKILLEK